MAQDTFSDYSSNAVNVEGWKVVGGTLTVNMSGGFGTVNAVPFGVTFSGAPFITATARASGNAPVCVVDGATTTTFNMHVVNDSTSATTRSVYWIAVGPA